MEPNTSQTDKLIPESAKGENKRLVVQVAIIGFAFMFLFTAFSQCQGLASSLYKQLGFNNLGQLIVFSIYLCFAASNFVASNIKSKLSHKAGLLIGGSGYALVCLAGVLASYCKENNIKTGICTSGWVYSTSITSSCILGTGASILWVSQSSYVTDCSNEENNGKMFGLFWSIGQSAFLIGALASTFVLGLFSPFIFYLCMLGLLTIAIFIFTILPKAPDNPKVEPPKPLKESFMGFLKTFANKPMQPLFFCMFLGGLTLASYITMLPEVVNKTTENEDSQEQDKKLGLVLIALGVGEIIGGYFYGKLMDSHPRRTVININVSLIATAMILTLIAHFSNSYIVCIFAGLFWGIGDVTNQTLDSSCIGVDFEGNLDGFAMFRFLQSMGVVFGTIISLIVKNVESQLFIIFGCMIICFIGGNFYKKKSVKELKSNLPQLE